MCRVGDVFGILDVEARWVPNEIDFLLRVVDLYSPRAELGFRMFALGAFPTFIHFCSFSAFLLKGSLFFLFFFSVPFHLNQNESATKKEKKEKREIN
jgi:hypothetical protein